MHRDYRAVTEAAIAVDTHADTFGRVLDEGLDFLNARSGLAVTLPGMQTGGLDLQIFALYVAPGLPPGGTIKRTLQMAGCFFQAVAASQARFRLVENTEDITQSIASGAKCGMLSVEGGHALEGDLNLLRSLRALGVTSMTLTHSNSNEFADSSQGERVWGGLNELGRKVIAEMNRIRMLVDVSHTSDEAVDAAVACSKFPVIASHSCCYAVCQHPRNLPDELLKKIARRGGVIHMAYYPPFLDPHAAAVFESNWHRLHSTWFASSDGAPDMAGFYAACMEGVPEVQLSKLCDHIDHAVSVAGIDHVGLGSDWDGASTVVRGLETCAALPEITAALLERGYGESDVQKILGGNFMRVVKEVLG